MPKYRDISGFPGYRVGDDGTIWSLWKRGSLRRQGTDWYRLTPLRKRGYLNVTLCGENKLRKPIGIHVLVLTEFVGAKPLGMECRHLDGDRTNNHLSNLMWGSRKDNADDRCRHGTSPVGEKNPFSKLIPDQILSMRAMYSEGTSRQKLATIFNVHPAHVHKIVKRKLWNHL